MSINTRTHKDSFPKFCDSRHPNSGYCSEGTQEAPRQCSNATAGCRPQCSNESRVQKIGCTVE